MKIGDKIKFEGEKQRMTIKAFSKKFIILTKPFNAKKTYLYSIVDLEREVRGRCNLIFGSLWEFNTLKGAKKNLQMLDNGERKVSCRYYKKLEQSEISQFSK
jgi:hypothetical protein